MSATVARRNFFIFLWSPEIQSVTSVVADAVRRRADKQLLPEMLSPIGHTRRQPTACGTVIRGDSTKSQTGLKDALIRNPRARKRVRFISRRHAGAFSN